MTEYTLALSAKTATWFSGALYALEHNFHRNFDYHDSGMNSEAAGFYTEDLADFEKLLDACIAARIPHQVLLLHGGDEDQVDLLDSIPTKKEVEYSQRRTGKLLAWAYKDFRDQIEAGFKRLLEAKVAKET